MMIMYCIIIGMKLNIINRFWYIVIIIYDEIRLIITLKYNDDE